MRTVMTWVSGASAVLIAVQAGAGEVASRTGTITAVPVSAHAVEVRVQSVHGWHCVGLFAKPAQEGEAVQFPLTCSDKVEARALMSVEDGRAALVFRRKDGNKGSAALTLD